VLDVEELELEVTPESSVLEELEEEKLENSIEESDVLDNEHSVLELKLENS